MGPLQVSLFLEWQSLNSCIISFNIFRIVISLGVETRTVGLVCQVTWTVIMQFNHGSIYLTINFLERNDCSSCYSI